MADKLNICDCSVACPTSIPKFNVFNMLMEIDSSTVINTTNSFDKLKRLHICSLVVDAMQQKVISPLFDVRLMYSAKDWYNELSKDDIKYIKEVLFDALFEKNFSDYAKGIQTNEEKIELVHSKLKSLYREQQDFIKEMCNE